MKYGILLLQEICFLLVGMTRKKLGQTLLHQSRDKPEYKSDYIEKYVIMNKMEKDMKVKALIERTEKGFYSIACDAQIGNFCLGGFGNSVEEAKADFASIVKEAQDCYVNEHGSLPDDFKTIEVDYKYDLQSFFNYFNWINISKFAKAAGINESKMRQYKTGKAFASERTKDTIEATIHRMSEELASVEL